jgi:metacaspase-1
MAQAAAPRDSGKRSPLGRALCVGVDAGMDARRFLDLAVERGFVTPVLLIDEAATCAAVRAKLAEMAAACEKGDLFLLTFSGHGGDTGTWQLRDGKLSDEQLRCDLAAFRRGVRVLVVSDSCGGGVPGSPRSPGGSDQAPPLSHPSVDGFLKASVLVFAACQRGRYADGEGLPGHFAAAMIRVLNGFSGNYYAFYRALYDEMPAYQKPDYYCLGIPNPVFEAQQPFTI